MSVCCYQLFTMSLGLLNPGLSSFSGVLRPLGRLLGRLAVRGAVALHVSVLRHVPALLRGTLDGAVALANLLGDVLGVTAQAGKDWEGARGEIESCGSKSTKPHPFWEWF